MDQGYMGEQRNMSALEKKVDALMLFCTAETEEAKRRCRSGLQALLETEDTHWHYQPDPIDRALADLGIPDHLLGYDYLQSAIRLCMQDRSWLYNVTKNLYPELASRYHTRPSLIERGIRHAIGCGWTRCDLKMHQRYFGGKVDPKRCKPTNVEFLARMCNVLSGQYS